MLRPLVRALVGLTIVMLASAMAPTVATAEEVQLAYKKIEWNWLPATARLESDFRRAVAARQINISAAELAATIAVAIDGVTHFDNWRDQTSIRGCGPSGQLCFVIVCDQCSGVK